MIWDAIGHLIGHLYDAMWSNIWAPSAWTLVGIGMSHAHQVYLQNKHHDEHMQALTNRDSK